MDIPILSLTITGENADDVAQPPYNRAMALHTHMECSHADFVVRHAAILLALEALNSAIDDMEMKTRGR